jgi:hypothetical protein
MKPSDYIQGQPTAGELMALLAVFIAEETDPPFMARVIKLALGPDFLRFLPEGFDPDKESPGVIGSI